MLTVTVKAHRHYKKATDISLYDIWAANLGV